MPKGKITHAEFSPDGKHILTASEDGVVKLWSPDKGDFLYQEGHQSRIRHAEFNRDGKLFVTVDDKGNARIWNTETRKSTSLNQEKDERFDHAIFSPKEDMLVTTGTRGALLWQLNADSPKSPRTLVRGKSTRDDARADGQPRLVDHPHAAAAFSSDGKRVVVAGDTNSLVLEVATGNELFSLRHYESVNQIAYSPDGTLIASVHKDRFGERYGMDNREKGFRCDLKT